MSAGEAVIRSLETHGVECVFGIPGTHSLPIYKYLAGSRIRHVLPRHEQGAGFAADGYARASGRPGVCIVTTGPGVTNIATAAAEAYSDSVPMLIISPGMPTDVYGREAGYVHEAKDQSKAMGNLVAWSHRATSPADVTASINRAFGEFASSRPRPVHLEIPLDIFELEEAVDTARPASPSPPRVDEARITEALDMLNSARCPGLLLGGGAQGASAEVTALARALDAIVVTSANGKGAFPERDELAIGAVLNFAAGRDALVACDVVVAVGTELSDSDLEGAELDIPGHVIRIDIDAGQLQKHLASDCAIHADAAEAVRQLLAGLKPRQPSDGAARARHARARLENPIAERADGLTDAVDAIRRCVEDDTIVVCDTSMLSWNGLAPARLVNSPRSFLNPTGYATLGYALPAGIGAKLAHPYRGVIVVIGDGGILFTLSELATAVQEKLCLPIVVTNNTGYGEIRHGMIARGIEPIGVTFDAPNFSLIAQAFGAHSATVADGPQLETALRAALEAHGPTLIEVVS
jgi:acetolactate synthase-1/2/3 large subunit